MITQERVREVLEYRDGKLYWKQALSSNIEIGRRAGTKSGIKGYQQIRIDKKSYYEHQLIYLLFKGYIPKQIDHIVDYLTAEGIKCNCIENLQETTNGDNLQKSTLISGTSKYKGVHWDKINRKWKASGSFRSIVRHLGRFKNEKEAAKAYDKFTKEKRGGTAYLNFEL